MSHNPGRTSNIIDRIYFIKLGAELLKFQVYVVCPHSTLFFFYHVLTTRSTKGIAEKNGLWRAIC